MPCSPDRRSTQVFCCAVGYGLDISASTTESMSKGAPPLRRIDMADIDPIEVSNLDIYGNAPLEWSRAREQLARWHGPDVTHFLCTTRPDGQPHVAGVGATWLDGDPYIVSGDGTRKSKNRAIHPACSIAVRLPGIDVTLEGTAAHVTDAQTLDRVAALYRQLGWPADGDAAALQSTMMPRRRYARDGSRGISLATSIPTTVSSADVVMNQADAGDKTHTCDATDGPIHWTATACESVRAVRAPSRHRPDQSPPRSDRSLTSAPSLQ